MSDSEGTSLLEVRELRKGYGSFPVLRSVSFLLEAGEGLVVLGPNGAGKSTLLRSIAGLQRPQRGSIRIAGATLSGGGAALRRWIGFVSHESMLYGGMTAEENLELTARLYGVREVEPRVAAALERFDLTWARRRPVRTFSRGMTQRLALARALLPGPKLLLLDEPTAGLDPTAVRALDANLMALREGGVGLLWTTHDLGHLAPLAGRVAFLRDGRLQEPAGLDPADRRAVETAYEDVFGIGPPPGAGSRPRSVARVSPPMGPRDPGAAR